MNQSIKFSTLVELLRARAGELPDKVGYTFLVDGKSKEVSLTYAQLDQQARAIAAKLLEMGASGERALLFYPSGLEFIAAFFGCLYAGVVAVPTYPPRRNRPDHRVAAIVKDAQAKVLLSTSEILAKGERHFAHTPELSSLQCLSTDNLGRDDSALWQAPAVSRDSLAFLQYTSGSTGTPKGVMVTHSNLLYNQEMLKRACGHSESTLGVSWLPLFHDLGLIANVLQTLYLGASCILMSPMAFLQKPIRWLQAISRYAMRLDGQAITSGGPNFAYDLCVSKIKPHERATLDLSSWRVAFNGAEPVRAETLERFVATFEPCGFRRETFYPSYGTAEATVFVSGGLPKAPPVVYYVDEVALLENRVVSRNGKGARAIVGCGRSWLEQQIVIVDPDAQTRCPDEQVGEIWLKGPNVALGYWNRPEESEKRFNAYLSPAPPQSPPILRSSAHALGGKFLAPSQNGKFLRTGDFGFLQYGQLFITGRLKDLIIIRGRNHYPQDIEQTVQQSHPALRPNCAAAFLLFISGQERLIVAQEIKRTFIRKLDRQRAQDEIIGDIRQAVARDHSLQVYAVLLLKTASIPKTSSGKIQRHACRARLLANTLNIVASDRSLPLKGSKE